MVLYKSAHSDAIIADLCPGRCNCSSAISNFDSYDRIIFPAVDGTFNRRIFIMQIFGGNDLLASTTVWRKEVQAI